MDALEEAILVNYGHVAEEGDTKSSTESSTYSVKAYKVGTLTRIDVKVKTIKEEKQDG
jgi:cytochrome oxidase assembly protein ShyY1